MDRVSAAPIPDEYAWNRSTDLNEVAAIKLFDVHLDCGVGLIHLDVQGTSGQVTRSEHTVSTSPAEIGRVETREQTASAAERGLIGEQWFGKRN